MNSKTTKIGACILACDMNTLVPFYRDVLGFTTKWDGGDFAEFESANGYLSFFMYSRKMFTQALEIEYKESKGINQTFEIGLWLPTFSEVDAEYERLSKLNVNFPCGEPKTFPFGVRNFYVADPEGNLLEVGSWNKD